VRSRSRLDDREPESDAPGAARAGGVSTCETPEDPFWRVTRDAGPLVGDFD
jgi:hypothetical protein